VAQQGRTQSIEERELDLALREAELNRREAAIRRGEEDMAAARPPAPRALTPYDVELERELASRLASVEKRERELEQVVEAVEAQRKRLEEVQREYEERRTALTQRARELEQESMRLKEDRARVAEEALTLAQQPRTVVPPVMKDDVETEPLIKPAVDALLDPAPKVPGPLTIDDWWAKQLGSPLEAA
jgi:chromosome segregation ATPase